MSSKYAGYTGKVMLVDLSSESAQEYPWTDRERELYLGGKFMANKILCDHLTGSEQAFSEENWIVIATGPLTLTGAPSSSRYDMASLSPATGLPASSNCLIRDFIALSSSTLQARYAKTGSEYLSFSSNSATESWFFLDISFSFQL